MKFIQGISQIVKDYDLLIVDIWGVIHDGNSPYPDIIETLTYLRQQQKKIILLSNAPRRASKVKEVLEKMKITDQYYDLIISSGELVHHQLQKNSQQNYQFFKKNFFYIGPNKDQDLIADLNYQLSSKISEADFVLTTGFDHDQSQLSEKIEFILEAKKYNLPMICANPDLIVVRQNGDKMLCAGIIAKEYQKIQGQVFYFGKPYIEIYQYAITLLQNYLQKKIEHHKILAIGDGLETDILGANNFQIDNLFITDGILSNEFKVNLNNPADLTKVESKCKTINIIPKFIISKLII
jgi:HAD superfamily hydrolase (TIGR01459 family)